MARTHVRTHTDTHIYKTFGFSLNLKQEILGLEVKKYFKIPFFLGVRGKSHDVA